MKSLITRFVNDESGATAIEYGLIAAIISLVVAVAGPGVAQALTGIFGRIAAGLNNVP
jgi:pilus assembly protein Flp/PilA